MGGRSGKTKQGVVLFCGLGLFRDTSKAKRRDQVPISVTRAECGELAEGGLPCLRRGCRAPELAAGALREQLDAAFQSSLACLTLKWRPAMTTGKWTALLAEFGEGKKPA
jgi:hypothetical protein